MRRVSRCIDDGALVAPGDGARLDRGCDLRAHKSDLTDPE